MLVVSRKPGQEIQITVPPSDREQVIDVRICEIPSRSKTRVGIRAPKGVAIERDDMIRDRLGFVREGEA